MFKHRWSSSGIANEQAFPQERGIVETISHAHCINSLISTGILLKAVNGESDKGRKVICQNYYGILFVF